MVERNSFVSASLRNFYLCTKFRPKLRNYFVNSLVNSAVSEIFYDILYSLKRFGGNDIPVA